MSPMPETPDGGWELDPPEPPPYQDPMTEEERAELRRLGATDDEIRALEADRQPTPGRSVLR